MTRYPTPIVSRAGERFLERLQSRDPQLYTAIISGMRGGNMAGMGDIWSDISDAVGSVIRTAPQFLQTELEAKRRMDAAEKMAQEELDRAALQIQQQQLQAQNYQSAQQLALMQSQLEQEKANLAIARESVLSAGQKMSLGVAAMLGVLLIVMVTRRKRGARR